MSDTKYMELVLVRFGDVTAKSYLFEAPAWKTFNPGDRVVVNTEQGTQDAWVVNSLSVAKGSEEFDFIVECAHATLPLKRIKSKLKVVELEYDDEEPEDE